VIGRGVDILDMVCFFSCMALATFLSKDISSWRSVLSLRFAETDL